LPPQIIYGIFLQMKKLPTKAQEKRRKHINASCDKMRQECNKLTNEERQQLHAEALAIIYGHDAKIPARSH
jgi:vacuolar-type H+-ATPase subunit H